MPSVIALFNLFQCVTGLHTSFIYSLGFQMKILGRHQGFPHHSPIFLASYLQPDPWPQMANVELREQLRFSGAPIAELQFLQRERESLSEKPPFSLLVRSFTWHLTWPCLTSLSPDHFLDWSQSLDPAFFFLFKILIYFWLHWVFVVAQRLSLVVESWG